MMEREKTFDGLPDWDEFDRAQLKCFDEYAPKIGAELALQVVEGVFGENTDWIRKERRVRRRSSLGVQHCAHVDVYVEHLIEKLQSF